MIEYMKTFSPYVVLFFIPLVFLGDFFFLNLTLAIIKFSFTTVMNEFRNKRQLTPSQLLENEYNEVYQ